MVSIDTIKRRQTSKMLTNRVKCITDKKRMCSQYQKNNNNRSTENNLEDYL